LNAIVQSSGQHLYLQSPSSVGTGGRVWAQVKEAVFAMKDNGRASQGQVVAQSESDGSVGGDWSVVTRDR
jgi:hypothetical protein